MRTIQLFLFRLLVMVILHIYPALMTFYTFLIKMPLDIVYASFVRILLLTILKAHNCRRRCLKVDSILVLIEMNEKFSTLDHLTTL